MIKKLSHSLEDYLEAIHIISLENRVVRVKEVSEYLKVKMPSVVDAINKLSDAGFVEHEKYSYLELTEKGKNRAKKIFLKHEKLYKFLKNVLNVRDDIAKADACNMEHYISQETMEHLIKFIKFIETCPDSCPDGYPEWMKHFYYYLEHGKRPSECIRITK
jgi:DtxR family transcriptional regulator, Mn-dependent transcriptional regulator